LKNQTGFKQRREDKYIINGQKCFITNGSVADFFVLYAYTAPNEKAKGISAFVVEKEFAGLEYGKNENKMGMRGSINSQLFFNDLEVPAENRIGEEGAGFANLMQTLSYSRLFCAAQAVGIAQGALEEAVSHAKTRVQFGKPIAALSPIKFMIADMATAECSFNFPGWSQGGNGKGAGPGVALAYCRPIPRSSERDRFLQADLGHYDNDRLFDGVI
jgi:alkylation response protein AidB-like acyl-CoA dehydrogenase